MIKKIIPLE